MWRRFARFGSTASLFCGRRDERQPCALRGKDAFLVFSALRTRPYPLMTCNNLVTYGVISKAWVECLPCSMLLLDLDLSVIVTFSTPTPVLINRKHSSDEGWDQNWGKKRNENRSEHHRDSCSSALHLSLDYRLGRALSV